MSPGFIGVVRNSMGAIANTSQGKRGDRYFLGTVLFYLSLSILEYFLSLIDKLFKRVLNDNDFDVTG